MVSLPKFCFCNSLIHWPKQYIEIKILKRRQAYNFIHSFINVDTNSWSEFESELMNVLMCNSMNSYVVLIHYYMIIALISCSLTVTEDHWQKPEIRSKSALILVSDNCYVWIVKEMIWDKFQCVAEARKIFCLLTLQICLWSKSCSVKCV